MAAASSYEEARKQHLEENKKRLEDLGILKISQSLSFLTNSNSKSQKRPPKPKPESVYMLEPRRSSRVRNSVASYCDEIPLLLLHEGLSSDPFPWSIIWRSWAPMRVDISLPPLRKRSKLNSSWASYLARPLNEVRTASYEERVHAIKAAEEIQSNLQSGNPSFVKSMVRSHVYSCFWLGLPSKFCEDHLPKTLLDMVLEDENGTEYGAVYIGKRTGLSGGWRGFALDHKLDDGDALVFELIEPARFKVYIVRASEVSSKKNDADVDEVHSAAKRRSKRATRFKVLESSESTVHQGGGVKNEDELEDVNATEGPRKRITRSKRLTKKLS
ncbi:putative B3 domain-containing protein [Vitis vinifera]|uniref:Putative B3 domain-containing protein n=1 Tax=Vitis vinifera TaxID=29760 RepID=A0A438F9A0_VITVI|nr:putative B3 domain-containing protein [Vitis vinifera]